MVPTATPSAYHQIQQLRVAAVPLQATHITPEGAPVLVLDTTGQPEIADLFRVQAQAGAGEAQSTWYLAQLRAQDLRCAWLVVQFVDPVEVTLVVEFNLDDACSYAVLEAAEQSGTIWLITQRHWRPRLPLAGIRIETPPLPI